MRWTAHDRLRHIQDQQSLATNYTKVYCLIPHVTSASNYDPFTDSALDPTDTSSESSGEVITWLVREVYCRIAGPTFSQLTLSDGNGLEIGDLSLFAKVSDGPTLQSVYDDERAYLVINGQTYKLFGSLNKAGVYSGTEYQANAKRVTPSIRAAGY